MPRYKFILEYDGMLYSGFQRQQKAWSVQQALEEAFEKMTHTRITVFAAGRTDAGVHALGQVCHVDLPKPYPPRNILRGINFYLCDERIVVLKVEEVADDFHARFSATARSYEYRILNRLAPPAIDHLRVWHVHVDLDAQAMNDAATVLLGTHDFTTFRARRCQADLSVRTLDQLTVTREGDRILIRAKARSFLHHQVRNMVGSLYWVGVGHWNKDDLQKALEAQDRTRGGQTAPPHGLYLTHIDYP